MSRSMVRLRSLFRGRDLDPVAHRDDVLTHGEPSRVDVNVGPPEAEHFTVPHPGHGREEPRNIEEVVPHGPEERAKLGLGPRLHLPLGIAT